MIEKTINNKTNLELYNEWIKKKKKTKILFVWKLKK